MSLLIWIYSAVLLLLVIEIIKLIRAFINRSSITREEINSFPFISVLIPARNEEKRITPCLETITQQNYPKDRFEIIVIDDNSTDGTASIIQSFMEKTSNLIMVRAGTLPEGWSGKSYACHIGSQKAKGDYLCFIDADVTCSPELLKESGAYILKKELDVLSLVPFQDADSPMEKLLLLPVFAMIGASLPQDHYLLNGQFMLFIRKTYDEIGGHTLVKNTVAEDLDFSEFFRDKNYRIEFVFAESLFRCRMYDSYGTLSKGLSKMIIRLMSDNVLKAIWLSVNYFLFALFSLTAALLFLSGYSASFSLPEKLIMMAVPLLVFSVAMAFTFYFRIFFLYGVVIPLGWLYQPIFFFHSIRGKFRKYYEWRGRKVYHR